MEIKTLGECNPGQTVTLLTGLEVEVIRQNESYPWYIVVRETESNRECEYHKSARLK